LEKEYDPFINYQKNVNKPKINLPQYIVSTLITSSFTSENSVDYFGTVNYATNERVLERIRVMCEKNPRESIYLTVTSPGGPTGTAMSFYDHVRYVLKPLVITIGSGDVDSSGLIIFLTGERRFVTKHTTFLFHLAGRVFENDRRFTASDMDAMTREDRKKDEQYASLVAERSRGRLSKENVMEMMKKNTILSPEEFVSCGLADAVLE